MASSRVGVSTNAFISRRCFLLYDKLSCWMMGMAKAAVLPVPVWAMPSKSRPLSATGIACSCIGVGFSYFFSARAFSIGSEIFNSLNVILYFMILIHRLHIPCSSTGGANIANKIRGRSRDALPARILLRMCHDTVYIHFRDLFIKQGSWF